MLPGVLLGGSKVFSATVGRETWKWHGFGSIVCRNSSLLCVFICLLGASPALFFGVFLGRYLGRFPSCCSSLFVACGKGAHACDTVKQMFFVSWFPKVDEGGRASKSTTTRTRKRLWREASRKTEMIRFYCLPEGYQQLKVLSKFKFYCEVLFWNRKILDYL